jgi:hypothetical protein
LSSPRPAKKLDEMNRDENDEARGRHARIS